MTTQKTLDDIKRSLKRGQQVPSGDVRALIAICETLLSLVTRQRAEIQTLQAALPKPDPETGTSQEVAA